MKGILQAIIILKMIIMKLESKKMPNIILTRTFVNKITSFL